MNVQRIMAAMPISVISNLGSLKKESKEIKNVTNPIENQQNSKVSQIMRNYFVGSQMVNPAFTGFPCSTSNFRVKQLKDMPCTCCGRPMMTSQQIVDFAEEASNLSGKNLDEYLEKNMDYFRAEEKAVVHYIQKQLKTMPDATLTTAIRRTDADPEKIFRDEQIDVLNRTIAKSQELLGEKNSIRNLCERELQTKLANKGNRFNRTDFLESIVKLEDKGIEHKDIHKILDVAVQLPDSEKAVAKMIKTYAFGSDLKFANRLIQKSIVTAEHIHPKSKGGPNATDNYMGECTECNSKRGNMSYDEWMKRYPNMPDNIQVNIDAVTEEIIKGKIGGNYDDYPVDLKEAINKETNGKVVLKVKNPEEIDKARAERGIAKPVKDEKEKQKASGSYNGPQIVSSKSQKTENAENAENTKQPKKSGKKHKFVQQPEITQEKVAA